ncbi:MAG: stage 0 sporulation family protein [Clostridia bacterium]
MAQVVGVRFREIGKVYYFDPDSTAFQAGDRVIVETSRGIECGEIVTPNREVDDEKIVKPLKVIIRAATPEDLEAVRANQSKERRAAEICKKKIAERKLEMKLINVEYTFDSSKILFYFTADGRVDFRELVKDLAGIFHTRIELRQIGVRDESRMLGGLGICGRPFCCCSFLGDFHPVSIKMAKEQGLSLNPTKISGACGRLMCCLKYEQSAYDYLLKITPRTGAQVTTPEGRGVVADVSLISGVVKVRLDKNEDAPPRAFDRSEVQLLRKPAPIKDEQGERSGDKSSAPKEKNSAARDRA